MSYLPTDAVAHAKPTFVRYQVLGWLCLLSMITYIDRVCIKQVGGDMQQVLGVTPREFAWAFAAFGLAYALLEVPSGWLGDRLGTRKVLTRIVLCWSLFTALTGCVWQFTLDSGTVAGFMNMVGNLGTFVNPPIVAHLARHGEWGLALVYSAGMFFTAAAGWAFINPKRVIVYTPEDRRRVLQTDI